MLRKSLFNSGWRNIVRRLPAGSVLALTPEGRSQTTILDISGNANNGTITGAAWTRLPSGLWCLYYDGNDDKVVVADHASLKPAQITVLLWLEIKDVLSARMLVSKHKSGAAGTGYGVFHNGGDDNKFYLQVGDGIAAYPKASIVSTSAYTTPGFYFLAVTADGTNLNMYVNGTIAATPVAAAFDIAGNTQGLWIGRSVNDNNYSWYGRLGLTGICNRGLAANEIANYYNQTHSLLGV